MEAFVSYEVIDHEKKSLQLCRFLLLFLALSAICGLAAGAAAASTLSIDGRHLWGWKSYAGDLPAVSGGKATVVILLSDKVAGLIASVNLGDRRSPPSFTRATRSSS